MILNKVVQNNEKMWKIQPVDDNINLWRFDGYSRDGNEDIVVKKYLYDLSGAYVGVAPDFLFLNSGVIVISKRLKGSDLWWALNVGSEMIPIHLNQLKEKYYICNITYCPNVVNFKESILEEEDKYGERMFKKLYIKPDRIGGVVNVIKLGNDSSYNIYALQNRDVGSDMVEICKQMNIDVFTFKPLLEYKIQDNGDYTLIKDNQE